MDGTKRNTRQKQVVWELVKERASGHFTADDLLAVICDRGLGVGKTTIYRILKQLESDGSIKRYQLSDGAPACYQYIETPSECSRHYHLMCESCGQIGHFESDLLMKLRRELKGHYGFQVNDQKTVLYGLCKNCLKEDIN